MPSDALKWVESHNQHLTLKFIGDLPEKSLPEAIKILQSALRDQPAFSIRIKGLGAFPNWQNPRVVWLGIQHDQDLIDLHKRIEDSLSRIGIPAEGRKFSPHLTIARLRRNSERDAAGLIGKTLSQFKIDSLGTAIIDQIQFYQSDLTPKGPIYSSLQIFPLNKV